MKWSQLRGVTVILTVPSAIQLWFSGPCLQGLQHADPAFDKPGRVDLLLVVDSYFQIQLPR